MARKENMFAYFAEQISMALNREEAIERVYFGKGGIHEAFINRQLTFKETMLLKELIRKMA